MELHVDNTGFHTIKYLFDDVRNLSDNQITYSPTFQLCNTSWALYIQRTRDDNDVPYLGIYLNKVENELEDQYSFEVKWEISLLSTDERRNITLKSHETSSKTRIIFGNRSGESRARGFQNLITWGHLLNPQLGYIGEDKDDIEIELQMTLVKIWSHREGCECGFC